MYAVISAAIVAAKTSYWRREDEGAHITRPVKMTALPMSITDWTQISPTKHPGETGFALWKTQTFGDIRVRMVEYSPGYAADHGCSKGHVILCLTGRWPTRTDFGFSGNVSIFSVLASRLKLIFVLQ